MDKLYQDGTKCPQIENLEKITPEQAAEYVRFVGAFVGPDAEIVLT